VKPEDIQKMMEQAQQMQSRVSQLQSELAARSFEASSGGGMVTARVSGALRVLDIQIEPALMQDGDREMLQDLCAAAVNAAFTKAQEYVQQQMQQLSFGGPGGPGFPAPPGGEGDA
jgi:DNA-binding YbaB/EbfC family protein